MRPKPATFLAPLLATLVLPFDADASAIPYEQTAESKAVFATAEELDTVAPARLMALIRSDPIFADRCEDYGTSIYCSALRFTYVDRKYYPGLFPPRGWKPSWGYRFEEVRYCIRPNETYGLVLRGAHGGVMSEELADGYPNEMRDLESSPFWKSGEVSLNLIVDRSVGEPSREISISKLGMENVFEEFLDGVLMSTGYPDPEGSTLSCARE